MWNTKLKHLCQIPVMGAPMADHAGGALAAAVSNASALGFVGGGHALFSDDLFANLVSQVELYRTLTAEPLHVGLIGHSSLQDGASVDRYRYLLQTYQPKIVQFFAPAIKGDNVKITHDHGALFWAMVGTLHDAQLAMAAGVDGLILQGSEAGGHGLRKELGNATLTLANNVLQTTHPNVPILAAGGMAAMMLLGCDGVVLGTRLWASQEALGEKKHALADPNNTCDKVVRTEVFDAIQNTYSRTPWPHPYDSVGALRNETYETFRDAKFDDNDVAFYREHLSDPNIGLVHAGEGVGLISSILPAAEIVSVINQGAMEWIQSASQRLFE